MLSGNHSDTSGRYHGRPTISHELPLRYCRSLGEESVNGKKPTSFGKLSTCLLKPSYPGLYMLRASTLARLAGFGGLIISITLQTEAIGSLFRPSCAILLHLEHIIHKLTFLLSV